MFLFCFFFQLNNGYLVEIKKQTSVTDIPAASVQPENSKTSSKIDEKNTIIHKKQKENEPQTRKQVLQKKQLVLFYLFINLFFF